MKQERRRRMQKPKKVSFFRRIYRDRHTLWWVFLFSPAITIGSTVAQEVTKKVVDYFWS